MTKEQEKRLDKLLNSLIKLYLKMRSFEYPAEHKDDALKSLKMILNDKIGETKKWELQKKI